MTVTYVTGDLFEQDLPAIGHGCNCMGVMGAGIAVGFKTRYPAMFAEYRDMCMHSAFYLGDFFVWRDLESGKFIYNLGTQSSPGAIASLWAIRASLTKAIHDAAARGIKQIGLPRIGAGLGGLPWHIVQGHIEKVGEWSTVDIVIVSLEGMK